MIPTMSTKPSRRSPCPIACTLDLIGDRWTLLVIRDLFSGKSRFADLADSAEGIASNILADRLDRLTRAKLISAQENGERKGSKAYGLTPAGRSLYPLLVVLRDWGLANIRGTEARVAVADEPSSEASAAIGPRHDAPVRTPVPAKTRAPVKARASRSGRRS